MFPPFSPVSVRHRSPLDSSNPRTCALAMMPSRRLAANTRPTRPAPMTKPATSFAGGGRRSPSPRPDPERVAPRAVARRDAVARPPPSARREHGAGVCARRGAKEGRTCTRPETNHSARIVWGRRVVGICRRRGVLKFLAPPLRRRDAHPDARSLLSGSERPPHARARILAPPTSSTPPSLETRWPDSAT